MVFQFRITDIFIFTFFVAVALTLGIPWPSTTLATVPSGAGGSIGAAMTHSWRGTIAGATGALLLAVLLAMPFFAVLLLSGFIYPIEANEAPPPYESAFLKVWFAYLLTTGTGGAYLGVRLADQCLSLMIGCLRWGSPNR